MTPTLRDVIDQHFYDVGIRAPGETTAAADAVLAAINAHLDGRALWDGREWTVTGQYNYEGYTALRLVPADETGSDRHG